MVIFHSYVSLPEGNQYHFMTGRFPRGFPMMDPGSFDHLAVIMV